MAACIDQCFAAYVNRHSVGWMAGWKDGWTYGSIDGWINACLHR